MGHPDYTILDKLIDGLATLAVDARKHLAPPESARALAFLKNPAVLSAIAAVLPALIAVFVGMSKYEEGQIRNEKVSILEKFLPHISPEIATDKSSSSGVPDLDDGFQFQSYRRYVQGSERR